MSNLLSWSVNAWTLLFLLAVPPSLFLLWRWRRGEKLRRDLLAAFAARQDAAAMGLVNLLPVEEGRLWRRLITARAALVEAEQQQSRSRRELEDVLASLQDAVLVVDGECRLRFLNKSALELFEVRIESVLGANLVEALPSFDLDAAMQAALRENQSNSLEIHLYAPRMREMLLRVAPVFSGAGPVAGAVAILSDLTEIRRLERVRRDFVANASHELRTPIANIRATAETLLHAPDDADLIARFLPPLIQEAERLSNLVSDLLDLARAEAAEGVSAEEADLGLLVNRAVERVREKARKRDIALEWSQPEAAVPVHGDAAGLEQVAFNLLDNAMAYTPPGGRVRVTVREEASAEDGGQGRPGKAVVEFSDTGIGIPEQDIARVFERFYRVDKARSRSEGGTGLGLAIVKHIVENHGGFVTASSQEGVGSTFRVELPLPSGEDQPRNL